jgi:hypothetical protein
MKRATIQQTMIAIAVLAGLFGFCIVPVGRFNATRKLQRDMLDSIANLEPTNPGSVPPAVWDCALGETVIAFDNVGMRVGQGDVARRLRDDLERKLAGKVDLETLDWIWDRLSESGPHGRRYVGRFRPRFLQCFPKAAGTKPSRKP